MDLWYTKKRREGYYKPSWLASGKADNVGVEDEKVKGVWMLMEGLLASTREASILVDKTPKIKWH